MDREFLLLLTGAGISLVSGVITLVLQHFLSLRTDRIVSERRRIDERSAKLREELLRGIPNATDKAIESHFRALNLDNEHMDKKVLSELWKHVLVQTSGITTKLLEGQNLDDVETEALISLIMLAKKQSKILVKETSNIKEE